MLLLLVFKPGRFSIGCGNEANSVTGETVSRRSAAWRRDLWKTDFGRTASSCVASQPMIGFKWCHIWLDTNPVTSTEPCWSSSNPSSLDTLDSVSWWDFKTSCDQIGVYWICPSIPWVTFVYITLYIFEAVYVRCYISHSKQGATCVSAKISGGNPAFLWAAFSSWNTQRHRHKDKCKDSDKIKIWANFSLASSQLMKQTTGQCST